MLLADYIQKNVIPEIKMRSGGLVFAVEDGNYNVEGLHKDIDEFQVEMIDEYHEDLDLNQDGTYSSAESMYYEVYLEILKPVDYGDVINFKSLVCDAVASLGEYDIELFGGKVNDYKFELNENQLAELRRKVAYAFSSCGLSLNGYFCTHKIGLKCIFSESSLVITGYRLWGGVGFKDVKDGPYVFASPVNITDDKRLSYW